MNVNLDVTGQSLASVLLCLVTLTGLAVFLDKGVHRTKASKGSYRRLVDRPYYLFSSLNCPSFYANNALSSSFLDTFHGVLEGLALFTDFVNSVALLTTVNAFNAFIIALNYILSWVKNTLSLAHLLKQRITLDTLSQYSYLTIKSLRRAYSSVSLSWLNSAIYNAYNNGQIRYGDFSEDPFRMKTESVFKALQGHVGNSSSINPNLLTVALVRSFNSNAYLSFLARFLKQLLDFVKPYLLSRLIRFIDHTDYSVSSGIAISLAIYLNSMVSTYLEALEAYKSKELNIAIESSLKAMMYKKLLRLSPQSKEQYSYGRMLTLLTSDVRRVSSAADNLSSLVLIPAQLLVCLVSLWNILGLAILGSLLTILVFITLNSYIFELSASKLEQLRTLKIKRDQAVNELFSSMKAIKLYAWESVFIRKLFFIREDEEIPAKRGLKTWNRLSNLSWLVLPFVVSFVTFSLQGSLSTRQTTTDIIFPTLTLLLMLQSQLTSLPQLLSTFRNARLSIKEITAFMNAPEIKGGFVTDDSNSAIKISNMSFSWGKQKEETIALKDISLDIKKGELACITGKVGSGKSALLLAILGELELSNNNEKFTRNGLVAYVSQTPWIVNGSIRDNILFGQAYQRESFETVLSACQLQEDIERLPNREHTVVGEKGTSLSGGQRARVALARAVYSGADILILDDVLSAVDNHVARKLIEQLFSPQGLLNGKTVVLATSNTSILGMAKKVYSLEEGKMTAHAGGSRWPGIGWLLSGNASKEPNSLLQKASTSVIAPAQFDYDPFKEHLERLSGRVVERSQKGTVLSSTYLDYIKSCSVPLLILSIALSILSSMLLASTRNWLKLWSDNPSLEYSARYALFGIATELVSFLGSWLVISKLAIDAGQYMFRKMTFGLVGSSMAFFDTTPVGRIISRYGEDLEVCETLLPSVVFNVCRDFLSSVVTVMVITYNSPVTIPLLFTTVLAFWYYQAVYISAQREFKRLSSGALASFFSLVQASLDGASTIRAYGQETWFEKVQYADNDFQSRTQLLTLCLQQWLSIRLLFFTSSILFFCSLYFVVNRAEVTGGTVGMVMSYAFTVSGSFRAILGGLTRLTTDSVAVERCLEYATLVPEEGPKDDKKGLPTSGDIRFENYSAGYKESEPVLKNINVSIKAGEKIGVVGRTGAGKSSLVLALFRMMNPIEGRILIGDKDIQELNLDELRKSISIIPQDPCLFLGTIRQNIDPFNEYPTHRIWKALEDAKLIDMIQLFENGLQSRVNDNGTNFSGGQKQLLCLARALLKDSRILVLDEATASVDSETDKLIQEVLATKTKGKTVLIIAHRTDTVLDSDKILALENGEVREFGSPQSLLKDSNSLFFSFINAGV